MVTFGKERYDWLKTKLELPNGLPSHNTFNRAFQIIDPEELRVVLAKDGRALLQSVKDKLIVFDGKKLRGVSPKSRGNKGLFILNAWVSENRLCIGQSKVMDKSNEITAIPTLLNQLTLKDSTVSIDAIGCQKNIAEQIIEAEADYVLAVKGNQKELQEEVIESFNYAKPSSIAENWEYDHGRYETRKCSTLNAVKVLSPELLQKWKEIATLVKIESTRSIKNAKTTETRYYISSHDNKTAQEYNKIVRGHWGIENQLHWHLDVTFREDHNRARTGNAPENLSTVRKMALYRITQNKSKLSMKKRRFKAALNLEYLEDLLFI
jgi:predicted transposase YbfD/YdcC